MPRPKTISDEAILDAARDVFLARGHAASTREVAQAAGISEAVLYQRFASKDDLFFAAMMPRAPDLDALLGPELPTEPAPRFVRDVLVRLAAYFAEVIPLALHVMTHPAASRAGIGHAQGNTSRLQEALARRLEVFERRKQIRKGSARATARLLVSLAHDSALTWPTRSAAQRAGELETMAGILWNGLAPETRAPRPRRSAREDQA